MRRSAAVRNRACWMSGGSTSPAYDPMASVASPSRRNSHCHPDSEKLPSSRSRNAASGADMTLAVDTEASSALNGNVSASRGSMRYR
eukprot:365219-Chlamydomonas_euryale.AAC.5